MLPFTPIAGVIIIKSTVPASTVPPAIPEELDDQQLRRKNTSYWNAYQYS
jgi:hypothetical protein